MKDIIGNSTFFGVMICILSYEIGLLVKRKWKKAFLNPLLISIIIVVAFLLIFHCKYDDFNDGAKYLSYLLTPATVCLAIPLYEQISLLKSNWKGIVAGLLSGGMTSMVCVLTLSKIFNLSQKEYVTLLPKSITTAIGMGISEEMGGIVTITVAVIIVTGVLGNVIAEGVCRLFRIQDPIAKGIGIGTSSHAVGTSRALEMGAIEGAMSSLSVAVAGLLTVIAASIFSQFM